MTPDFSSEKLKDGSAKYEQERIQVLQQERVYVQKKTFTKWCNSHLEKVSFYACFNLVMNYHNSIYIATLQHGDLSAMLL